MAEQVDPARRQIRRRVVASNPRWISFSRSATEYLEGLGVAEERVVQVQNCVDEAEFRRDQAPLVELQPKPVVLCVGQLVDRKGVLELLEAAAVVQGEGSRFSLLIVGDGPSRGALDQRARDLKLADVHFHGSAAAADMPALYSAADMLVFPTLEDAWGLVVNEALWSGLPVLGSRYAGAAVELLPPANVFDPASAEGFAAALGRAVVDGLASADPSVMLRLTQVAARITENVVGEIETRR